VNLPEGKGQDLALGPPPESTGERHGDPEVGSQLSPHGLEGGGLGESLPRRRFLDLADDGQANKLPILVGRSEAKARWDLTPASRAQNMTPCRRLAFGWHQGLTRP
jgi:hypothetical protein